MSELSFVVQIGPAAWPPPWRGLHMRTWFNALPRRAPCAARHPLRIAVRTAKSASRCRLKPVNRTRSPKDGLPRARSERPPDGRALAEGPRESKHAMSRNFPIDYRERIGNKERRGVAFHACSRSGIADCAGGADQQPGGRHLGRAAQAVSAMQAEPCSRGWENFYLIVGPSAGGADRADVRRRHADRGARARRRPSAASISTHRRSCGTSAVVLRAERRGGRADDPPRAVRNRQRAALALLGVAMGVRSAVGIHRSQDHRRRQPVRHVVVRDHPGRGLCRAGRGGARGPRRRSWSASAVAAALMALLLVSIHAEWDLVTFLAPTRRDQATRKAARARASSRSSSGESRRLRTSPARRGSSRP